MTTPIVMTRKELAACLNIHRKTLWEKLRLIGVDIPERRLLLPCDIKKILNALDIDDKTWQQILIDRKQRNKK